MASSKYWVVLFAVGEDFSGQCCVCAEREEEVEEIALPEIKKAIDKDGQHMKSHYDLDPDDIEIEEIMTLQEWEDEFDEEFEEEDLPELNSGLVFDFGT